MKKLITHAEKANYPVHWNELARMMNVYSIFCDTAEHQTPEIEEFATGYFAEKIVGFDDGTGERSLFLHELVSFLREIKGNFTPAGEAAG